MKLPKADVIVVGGGLAGLTAARRLSELNIRVVILESSDEVGGRLATIRIGNGWADAGAQFFTVRAPEFEQMVGQWLAGGLVFEWSRGWSNGSPASSLPDSYPRYAAYGGFGTFARRLAKGMDIQYSIRVVGISHTDNEWKLSDNTGQLWHSTGIILTPPVSQTLGLLDAATVWLPAKERYLLEAITYAPCLCGLFEIDGAPSLPEPGVVQRPAAPITWIADNRRKGVSSGASVVTVHASPWESRRRYSMTKQVVLEWMLKEVQPWLPRGGRVGNAQLVRWPYAIPETLYPGRCLAGNWPGPMALAGDAFDGPRMEGAVLSGMAAADALFERYNFT